MSRVFDAFRRAAAEQTESAPKFHDHSGVEVHGGVDVVAGPFPAEIAVDNLTFTGQAVTGGKSSSPLPIAASQDIALQRKKNGSFEDLIRDIAHDEKRLNL
jgi:hypothetical protein